MLKKTIVIILIILPLLCFSKNLTLNEIKLLEVKQVGKAHFGKWFFDIYDAYLYTNNGKFNWNKPFLLKIHYLRDINKKIIINKALEEIYKQHRDISKQKLKEYKQVLIGLIPNVKVNSNLYGYMNKNGYASIYSNNELIGQIPIKELSKYFFEIWLSDKTSNIELSKQLKGVNL